MLAPHPGGAVPRPGPEDLFQSGVFLPACPPDRVWRYEHSGLARLVDDQPEATVRTKLGDWKLEAV